MINIFAKVIPFIAIYIQISVWLSNRYIKQYKSKLVNSRQGFSKEKYERYLWWLGYLIIIFIMAIFTCSYGMVIVLLTKESFLELTFYLFDVALIMLISYKSRIWLYERVLITKDSGAWLFILSMNILVYLGSYFVMVQVASMNFKSLIIPNSDILSFIYGAICFMTAVLVYLWSLWKRCIRLQCYKINGRIEIKRESNSVEIIEDDSMIDYQEYSDEIFITYRYSVTSNEIQKKRVPKSCVSIRNDYIDWDCFDSWKELKTPTTKKIFTRYLKKKYKVHKIKCFNDKSKMHQYNIAVQTSELLTKEQVIPPITIAGGLLNIFSDAFVTEAQIYELFGQKVLDLIIYYNKLETQEQNENKIHESEFYRELLILQCAHYTAELFEFFKNKVVADGTIERLLLKNKMCQEIFGELEGKDVYKTWRLQYNNFKSKI